MKEKVFVYEIAWILELFRINIARDISKFTKISRAAAASDIWGVLKYDKSVCIPNTLKKLRFFLLILQGKEISHFTKHIILFSHVQIDRFYKTYK